MCAQSRTSVRPEGVRTRTLRRITATRSHPWRSATAVSSAADEDQERSVQHVAHHRARRDQPVRVPLLARVERERRRPRTSSANCAVLGARRAWRASGRRTRGRGPSVAPRHVRKRGLPAQASDHDRPTRGRAATGGFESLSRPPPRCQTPGVERRGRPDLRRELPARLVASRPQPSGDQPSCGPVLVRRSAARHGIGNTRAATIHVPINETRYAPQVASAAPIAPRDRISA
jgi:hypothetical protein